MTTANSTHLGDGVYLSDDGYQLWLAVNGHRNTVVALDITTFLALVREGKRRFWITTAL